MTFVAPNTKQSLGFNKSESFVLRMMHNNLYDLRNLLKALPILHLINAVMAIVTLVSLFVPAIPTYYCVVWLIALNLIGGFLTISLIKTFKNVRLYKELTMSFLKNHSDPQLRDVYLYLKQLRGIPESMNKLENL